MSEIISYKNKQPSLNQKKYITLETESLDYTKMSNILHTQGIEISKQTIESVFEKHNYHKNRLINEICDNIGNKNEKNTLLTQILTNELQLNIWSERQKFLDLILHRYINKQELNDDDFIKILIYTAVDLYPEINVSEIKQIATSNEVNMAVFMKSKNSTKFGKLFNSMTIFKKKQWAQIYVSIKKWNGKTYTKLKQLKQEQKYDDNFIKIGTIQKELNDDNFIKILIDTAVDLYPEINVTEIKQIATRNQVNVTIFMKSKNGIRFGKLFKSMTKFKKKQWREIYTSIKKKYAKTYTELKQSKTKQQDDHIIDIVQPLHRTVSYLEPDSSNEDTLNLFCVIINLNTNQKTAEAFLSATDWNIDAAIDKYYALSGNVSLLGSKYEVYNDSKSADKDEVAVYTEGIKFWYWKPRTKAEKDCYIEKK
eukprot:80965_1